MKATMATLKAMARKYGIEIEDAKSETTIYAYPPEGKSWEGGELTCLVEPYGSGGPYLNEWRQDAIVAMQNRIAIMGPELDQQ